MTHLNSAVKLLDRAAEKFNDKIAISDEWSEISFSELQRKGKADGTALAKTTPQGYMPATVMVYLKKSISCLVCFMGAMYSARQRSYNHRRTGYGNFKDYEHTRVNEYSYI